MAQSSQDDPEIRPTPTIEDYLAIMLVMARDGEDILASRLAESIGVSPPTVTMTLKRMERDGWIVNEGRKGINLTDHGRKAARSVIRRHMLTEWMLTRSLSVPWSRIHAEAHQIEHTISEDIEARMRSTLDEPQLCPHGNPLPGHEHITADWIPLTDFQSGQRAVIRRVHETAEDDLNLLAFLETNQIIPGSRVSIAEVLPFNQTVTILVENQAVVLGFTVAQHIFAEKTD